MIQRHTRISPSGRYDLAILGGGIYGACTALEAARRGLKPILLERDDFGGGTSWNSLRILHGGLRYLQSLDLPRFFESVAERRWFCRHFPDLVQPLPCLMPLYGRGLMRPGIFRPALTLNNVLSARCNRDVIESLRLPPSRVLSPHATVQLYDAADRSRLQGGAYWHDALMVNPQRILIEILRWADRLGAVALNYCEARGLLITRNEVRGVIAHDRLEDARRIFHADRVINCAGPAALSLAGRFGIDAPRHLWYPSVAANVFLNKKPPAPVALALPDERPGGRVYFMYPRAEGLYAGTAHFPRAEDEYDPRLTEAELHQMIEALNAAAPSLQVREKDVVRVYSGLLPVRRPETVDLSEREAIHDHRRSGGPAGFFTVRGIKYTTARRVAEKTLHAAFPERSGATMRYRPGTERHPQPRSLDLTQPEELLSIDFEHVQSEIKRMMREEAVFCEQDILYRRTDWAQNPGTEQRVLKRLRDMMPLLQRSGAHLVDRAAHPDPPIPSRAEGGAGPGPGDSS